MIFYEARERALRCLGLATKALTGWTLRQAEGCFDAARLLVERWWEKQWRKRERA